MTNTTVWLSFNTSHRDLLSSQLSSTQIPGNAPFSSANSNQQFPLFNQALSAYNPLHYNLDSHLQQDVPLSAYPPLDSSDAANALPYGRQVLQQTRQAPPLTSQNLGTSNLSSSSYTQSSAHNDHHHRHESCHVSHRTNHSSSDSQKVSLNRAAKQRGDPSCDPSLCYSADNVTIAPWGSQAWNGQPLFSYTPKGQWLRDRCFTKQQLREYADNCKQDTVFWVQQTPTQCNHRLDPEDRICRWANCPVPNRTITAGWLRVAFDEFPHLTSNGSRDPLKCAGSCHLWCFEQIFDPTEFHLSGRLRPESRQFPFEDKNVVTLEKLTDAGIIREAYQPWFAAQRMQRFNLHNQIQIQLPREYRETLSYRLNKYHLDNQTAARQKARSKRNSGKSQDERRTIDVHMGDLKMFVEITTESRRSKKMKRLRGLQAEDAGMNSSATSSGHSSMSSQPWSLTNNNPHSMGSRGQATTANWYPGAMQGHTFMQDLRPGQSSLAGMNLQELGYRGQSGLAQLSSGSGQSRGVNTSRSTPAFNLHMSNNRLNYFDPLNLANNAVRQSTGQSSATTSLPSNMLQDSHGGASTSHYSRQIPGSRFNTVTLARTCPSLRPLSTQPQRQHLFSGMAMPVKREEQEQLESPFSHVHSQFETPGNVPITSDADAAKGVAQPSAEELLGGSSGTSYFDSPRGNSTSQGALHLDHVIDPRLFEDELETVHHPKEPASEANNTFAGRPVGAVDCTMSPQDAAASESWNGFGSLTGFAGFSGADISPLFDDFAAANGVGESRNC